MTLVAIALLAAAAVVRSRLVREAPQSARITQDPELNYLYGSIDADERGLPYWVVVVLPRVFGREYLPGPGGYAALGLAWPEGTELPAGFAKQTIGVERVTFNCALCHTAQYRVAEHATPKIVAGGGSGTADIQGLRDFFARSAGDARFNADTILTEIDLAYRLGSLDRVLYRYVLIPRARARLLEIGQHLTSVHSTLTPTSKIPPLWRRTASVQPLVTDSAVVRGSTNQAKLARAADALDRWLKQVPAPSFPVPVSAAETALAPAGKAIFEQHCAACHAPAANAASPSPRSGDAAPRLDGLWLRGPYLRNASVPTVRDLLEPAMCRPKVFARGYDVLDTENLGFLARPCDETPASISAACTAVHQSACVPAGQGRRFDTTEPGHSNGGHEFGTALTAADKRSLIAFLKTF